MKPFSPRPIRCFDLFEFDGWTIKAYSVTLPGRELDRVSFEPAIQRAFDALPSPDAEAGRPGLGLQICHAGATADYLITAWWDRENELPMRIDVRPPGSEWRAPLRTEGICVWDLQILTFERDAWIETMLSGTADPEAWGERRLEVDVDPGNTSER